MKRIASIHQGTHHTSQTKETEPTNDRKISKITWKKWKRFVMSVWFNWRHKLSSRRYNESHNFFFRMWQPHSRSSCSSSANDAGGACNMVKVFGWAEKRKRNGTHTHRQMRALKRKAKKMNERTSNFPFVRKNKFVGRFGFWWGWRLGLWRILVEECKNTHGKHIQCVRLSPAYETWLSNIFYFMFWLHCNGFCWGRRFMAEWSARVFAEPAPIHDHTHTCSCAIAMPNVNANARVCVSEQGNKTLLLLLQSRHNIYFPFF